jgi:hypothetical protein
MLLGGQFSAMLLLLLLLYQVSCTAMRCILIFKFLLKVCTFACLNLLELACARARKCVMPTGGTRRSTVLRPFDRNMRIEIMTMVKRRN